MEERKKRAWGLVKGLDFRVRKRKFSLTLRP